ncbi:MAG: cytochrome c [Rhizobiales bacterium]|nr:cytochrome c [Hyphomicrobiales bacterium]
MQFLPKTLLAATALAVLAAVPALAGPADDAIKARQACMKANGGAMGAMVPMIKGEKPYDAAVVTDALAKTEAACAGWAGWWGDDTQKGESAETWSKAEVWTDKAGFEAAGAAYGKAFGDLKATTDEAGFKAAFGAFGGTCKGCHEKFRRPKE